jgi:hypothetical protein
MTRALAAATLALVLAPGVEAQRGRGSTGEKPTVEIVQTVGCAEAKSGAPETWWLAQAAEPRATPAGLFNTNQVDQAKQVPLGTRTFRLIGVPDFLTPEELLKSGQRSEFTTAETANATGQLRRGRKVLVKGMLIVAGDEQRLNLLSVVSLADTCQ